MIIKDEFLGAVPIPQTVATDLAKNNRIKRAKYSKKNKQFTLLQDKTPQCASAECDGDSEYALFPLTEINSWLKGLGIGEIKLSDSQQKLENYSLKIIFGTHYELEDIEAYEPKTYESVVRNGVEKFPVHKALMTDSKYDLPNKKYLGQQTSILSIIDKTAAIPEFKSILLSAGGDDLDVAKLCPPDCS